jgi:hypothetical protein
MPLAKRKAKKKKRSKKSSKEAEVTMRGTVQVEFEVQFLAANYDEALEKGEKLVHEMTLSAQPGNEEFGFFATANDVDVDDLDAKEEDRCAKCGQLDEFDGGAEYSVSKFGTKGFEASSNAGLPYPAGEYICTKCIGSLSRKEKAVLWTR